MKIILKEDIENLGFKYDLVEVKPGFATNFLFPKKRAVLATKTALKNRKEDLSQKSKKDVEIIKKSKEKAEELNKLEIKLTIKTADNGKIFGSIGNQDLANYLKKKGIEVEKKSIKITGDTIKTLGKYTASVRLHREVEATINFEVLAEKEENKKN